MKALRIFLIGLFVVGALAYLNIIIPQPQQTSAHTTVQTFSETGNGKASVSVSFADDSCGGYYKAPDSSGQNNYTTTATLTNTTAETLKNFVIHWKSYWCKDSSQLNPGNPAQGINAGSCTQDEKDNSSTPVDLTKGASVTFASPTRTSDNDYSNCGLFQNDLWYSYEKNGTTVTSSYNGKDFGFAGDGYCKLWDGHTLKSSNPWSPEWECKTQQPQTHLACQNNACVEVPGAGSPQCTQNPDSCAQQWHSVCMANTCRRAPGPGPSTCSQVGSYCGPQKHLGCVNNACVWVPGVGNPQCTQSPDSCATTAHLTIIKVVNNNQGGTKKATDFTLHVENGNGDVADSPAAGSTTGKTYTLTSGDYTVSEDDPSSLGYHQVSISGSCDSNGHVHLNPGDNDTCVIENADNGTNACTMPTCNTNISGCSYPYPDTTTCSCGPLVCITQTPNQNITVNVNQSQNQQQQQQQEVLAASVAPASSATSLPSTGAGAEVLLSLFGLLPIGWKLRKFV